jgi:terminal uridylyltransferase
MVLFVKLWAKRRMINSSYSGTLSSYGYVLMVLHFLVNVAQPPVLPNLQHPWRPSADCAPQGAAVAEIDGWTIDFWRNEDEIIAAAAAGVLTSNRESVGSLLAGFYQYYSSLGGGRFFHWTRSVLSLRTKYGTLTKEEKGWVKASTEESEGKKIQHRYLFAIEDPFELGHNVARTVTHNGIVAIRDEFRRAHHILQTIGHGGDAGAELLAQLTDEEAADKAPSRPAQDRKGNGRPPGKFQSPGHQQPAQPKQPDFGSAELFPALPTTPSRQPGRSK